MSSTCQQSDPAISIVQRLTRIHLAAISHTHRAPTDGPSNRSWAPFEKWPSVFLMANHPSQCQGTSSCRLVQPPVFVSKGWQLQSRCRNNSGIKGEKSLIGGCFFLFRINRAIVLVASLIDSVIVFNSGDGWFFFFCWRFELSFFVCNVNEGSRRFSICPNVFPPFWSIVDKSGWS